MAKKNTIQATGRRKSSVARVRMTEGTGSIKVNGVIETTRGRKLNKGDKVIFLKNELIFE